MNASLIANWNARIMGGDTVYICGDLMFRTAAEPELFLRQLRGKKHLVVGNHDSSWMKKVELSKHWIDVYYNCRRLHSALGYKSPLFYELSRYHPFTLSA